MQKITIKQLKGYFKNEIKQEPRHDLAACKKSFNQLNKELKTDVINLVRLIFENIPIDSLHTHSYGFHTRNGRHLIQTFEQLYYNSLKK